MTAVVCADTVLADTAGSWAAPATARIVIDERYVLAAAGRLAIGQDAAARLLNTL